MLIITAASAVQIVNKGPSGFLIWLKRNEKINRKNFYLSVLTIKEAKKSFRKGAPIVVSWEAYDKFHELKIFEGEFQCLKLL